MNKFLLSFSNLFIFCGLSLVFAGIEFSNIKCMDQNKTLVDIYDCRIVAVNRTYKYITVKMHLKKPVVTAKANIVSMKRLNGYKPFLYNFSYNACEYFLSRKNNLIVNYFFGFFEEFINFDHPCPYDHDIILDKLSNQHINKKLTLELPYPLGDYALYTTWFLNGQKHVDVRVFIKFT